VLSQLSTSFPDFGVWKGMESALTGAGDVDAIGERASWPEISRIFEVWTIEHGASAVVSCDHVPGVVHLLGMFPGWIAELDVCDEFYWRGSLLVTADQLAPLMLQDPSRLRYLRPGAAGLLLLLLNGVRRGGGADTRAIREKGVERLLRDDPIGVKEAAGLLGPAGRSALALTEAIGEGKWRRRASLTLEARALLRSVLQPRRSTARLLFRVTSARHCPVLVAVRNRRSIPSNPEAWLEHVDESHRVIRA
jgi:hypothetical protein